MLSGLLASGCVGLRSTPAPMPVERFARAGPGEPCPVVFLPGRWDRPRDFEREGFTDAVTRRHLQVEMVAADAHLGYYVKGLFFERMQADVVQPALASGSRPWLVGVSLGGFGALAYARHHPDQVAGVVALAPYLGDHEVTDEIAAAGGLGSWHPHEPIAADDFERDLWRWLQGYAENPSGLPPLVLGFGRDDRLAPAARLLAAVLPPDRVFEAAGRHEWDTWRALWEEVLDSGPLAQALRAGCREGRAGPAAGVRQ